MERKFGDKLGLLDLTDDEIKRLGECMKDDRFMDLLRDYTLAISDPENKKKYEEEIALMEAERGNDVKFIHPCPGHVLKTSRNGEGKCFINVCSSPKVGKPVSKPTVQGSTRGMQWSIPHSLSQPREDKDKAGGQCMVYDVVFNPDTYHMAEKNERFRKMIHDMALDAVERLFEVTLDKINVKKPKMKFKGLPQASIIRTPREDTRELDAKSDEDTDEQLNFPYPPEQNNIKNHKPASPKTKPVSKSEDVEESIKKVLEQNDKKPTPSDIRSDLLTMMQCIDGKQEEFVQPKYTLTHRGYFDMKDHYNITEVERTVHSSRPREIVVNIELPMLKAASALHLEIFEERVFLECAKPVKYKLDMKLPYPVDDSKGHARFDKSKRRLTITLEVLAPTGKHLRLVKASENENEDACGSCLPQHNMIKQHGEDEDSSDEDPSENDLLSSSHPSGLVHGRSTCRHQNHGVLWDVKYERDWEKDTNLGFRYQSSPLLVEKLASHICDNMQAQLFSKDETRIFYHQDEAFVTIIMNIKFIDNTKLWYVLTPNSLQFSAMTDPKRIGAPIIYQIHIQFNQKDIIDPRRSRVDVSDDNAVFLLRKHISSWHEWQTFEAGLDVENLKRLFFATEENVNNLITSTKLEAEKSVVRDFDCENVPHGQASEVVALKLLPKKITDEERLTGTQDTSNQYLVRELPTLRKILTEVCKIRDKDLVVKIDHEELLLKILNPIGVSIPQSLDGPETDEDDDSEEYETADDSSSDNEVRMQGKTKYAGSHQTTDSSDMKINGQKHENVSHQNKLNGVGSGAQNSLNTSEETGSSEELSNKTKKIQEIIAKSNEKVVIKKIDGEDADEEITNHTTKSVINLSNELLYEIDYD